MERRGRDRGSTVFSLCRCENRHRDSVRAAATHSVSGFKGQVTTDLIINYNNMHSVSYHTRKSYGSRSNHFPIIYIPPMCPLRKQTAVHNNGCKYDRRSLFTGNSLLKGPIGFKQNPNFLANPINNIRFKAEKHFTSSHESSSGFTTMYVFSSSINTTQCLVFGFIIGIANTR